MAFHKQELVCLFETSLCSRFVEVDDSVAALANRGQLFIIVARHNIGFVATMMHMSGMASAAPTLPVITLEHSAPDTLPLFRAKVVLVSVVGFNESSLFPLLLQVGKEVPDPLPYLLRHPFSKVRLRFAFNHPSLIPLSIHA
ncbi:hypothetical protein [Edaphobacter aggregans]|uniref:hypothetical protein n=1 Tax=Edaphobacter aggregans TaxID=570835 RepID=UPI0012F949FD|nr:hypothetical protein [Edaphobacter aggregans]